MICLIRLLYKYACRPIIEKPNNLLVFWRTKIIKVLKQKTYNRIWLRITEVVTERKLKQ